MVGKDSRTYPATLEQRKTHALAVAALRRQPRPLPLSCARTDYADKYAVSIRSSLTLLTATYFSSLTSFSFLGDVFYVFCRFSAFPLPPSTSYRRKHETAKLPYFDTTHCNVRRATELLRRTKIAVLRIVIALSPGIKRAISQLLYGLSTRNLLYTKVHRTMHKQNTVLTPKKYFADLWYLFAWTVTYRDGIGDKIMTACTHSTMI